MRGSNRDATNGPEQQRMKNNAGGLIERHRTNVLLYVFKRAARAEMVSDNKVTVKNEEPIIRFG
jgi:hypothetical protein